MFWIKIFLTVLACYIAYNGFYLFGFNLINLIKAIQTKFVNDKTLLSFIILFLISLMLLTLTIPIIKILDGSDSLNPVVIGCEIFLGILIYHEKISDLS